VRILVTNDDGVHAPGLAALVRALSPWAEKGEHDVVVAAPLANHSGASAAVGTFYEREAIGFRLVRIEGAEHLLAFGLDTTPAFAVILGSLGAFGPQPDVVVSGINLGVNVGRSVLHSGTVGAALTAAQYGYRALAISMRSQPEHHWATPAHIALAIIPVLASAPPRTVLSLNVPSSPLGQLRGVVQGRLSQAGLVRSAKAELTDGTTGIIRLTLGSAIPSLGNPTSGNEIDDTTLIGAGYATLTALHGVGEDSRLTSHSTFEAALSAATSVLKR
jgi:5'-nucleotidase